MGGVSLVALDANAIPTRPIGVQHCSVISPQDKGIARRERQVLGQRRGLINVISVSP